MGNEPAIDPLDTLRAENDLYGWGGTFEGLGSDDGERFEHPQLRHILALWFERCRGGIPRRADFDIRALKDVLPRLWMIESFEDHGAKRFRCRRMGTDIAAVFGDMTGKCLDEVIPPPLLPRWTRASEAFLSCRQPVRFTCHVDLPQANFLRAEAFHAPLLDASGRPTILMGVSYFEPVTQAS